MSNRIYRLKDRIPVVIDSLTFLISPLSNEQKAIIQGTMLAAGKDPMKAVEAARTAIKFSVKGIVGAVNADDTPYIVEFEDADKTALSASTLDDIMNMQASTKVTTVCAQLVAGIPSGFINPSTNKPLEGVSFADAVKKPQARTMSKK